MNSRDRRALLLGVAVIGGSLLILRVIPSLAHHLGKLRGDITERQEMISRARDVIANRRATQDALAQTLSAVVALAPKLSDGNTPPDAQAALSALVSLAAGRSNLKVVRLDPLPDSAVGAFNQVSLHAEIEGDLGGVTRLVRALETSRQLLSVTSLQINASEPGSPTSMPEVLRTELTVTGLYLRRGGS